MLNNDIGKIYGRYKQILFNIGSYLVNFANTTEIFYKTHYHREECEISNKGYSKEKYIIDKLEVAMCESRVYLNPDLSIESLAREVGTNRSYLSFIMSSYKNGFLSYINGYRLAYLMSLIKNDNKILLDDAIYLSGFKSRKTFCNVLRRQGALKDILYLKNRYICKSINNIIK